MDADGAVDDEFQPGQTHATIRDRREVEGAIRIAHVHHDLDRHRRHGVELDDLALELEPAAVDITDIPLGAGHGHHFAFRYFLGGIATAHDGGNAQLPRDDGRVTGAPAAIGDDRRRALHDRFPVRIGHVRHQHVARLHARHIGGRAHHTSRAGADAGADRAAGHDHRRSILQVVAMQILAGAALDGLGTRLQDIDPTGLAVTSPFDVHRPAVVLFDDQRLARECHDVGVAAAVTLAIGGRDGYGLHALPGAGRVGIDHLDGLASPAATHDRQVARAQCGLVYVELIRIDRALYHRLAEAIGCGDEDDVAKAGLGVEREHDAAGAEVAAYHELHAGGQCYLGMRKTVVHAVGDRAVIE